MLVDFIELIINVEEAKLSVGLAHGVCKKAEKEDWLKEYQPCPLGKVTGISQQGIDILPKRVEYTYNAAGQRTSTSIFAGTNKVFDTFYGYDGIGRLTGLTHTSGEKVFADYDFTWDVSSRITDFDFIYLGEKESKNTFGKVTKQAGKLLLAFGYTGKFFDSQTQLQWNLNRWYDSSVGRWISEDPIGFWSKDSNLSRYCWNACIIYSDPNGKELTFMAFCFLVGVAVVAGVILIGIDAGIEHNYNYKNHFTLKTSHFLRAE